MFSSILRDKRGASTIEYLLALSCVAVMLCPAMGALTDRSAAVFLRVSTELNGGGPMAVAVGSGSGSPLMFGGNSLTGGSPSSPLFFQGGGSGTTITTDESTAVDSEASARGESDPDSPGTSAPDSEERTGGGSSSVGSGSPRR